MSSTVHNLMSGCVEAAIDVLRRKPNLTNKQGITYLLLAAFLTVVVPFLQHLTQQRSGIAEVFLVLPFLGISSGVAFCLFTHERVEATLLTLLMFVFGVFLAGIGLVIFAKQGGITYRGSFTSIVAAVGIFNQSLIVPFYEEITVRTFLFLGMAKYLGFVLSAVAVSVLFGLAHGNISIFAFFVSVLLCYLAYRRVGVFDRTVLHGSYNFVLIILVFVFGRV